MLRSFVKQPFTTLTPSKCISKRNFTIKSPPSSQNPISTTISSRTFNSKECRRAMFFPAHTSNHAFTRTFKVYSLYSQLPVATTKAPAYLSIPKVNGISTPTSYYAALPLSLNFSYRDLECEVRDVLREPCRLAIQRRDSRGKDGDMAGKKKEEMGRLKLDITII
ncbi:uncharacterized protein Bfra_007158 [Botrytis fragariae]|uniref:Uncharacterized protein n=1 Tax=Botrytis fragariae TaxID=1964551 RepID=A0A8H6EDB6_9HELO|nr:uncharacterized protein Bfra_007158 [Botrytis fragariae]KAF5867963.1 hypothetical protein Bfra_007158 [Botrytis fragariae]